MEKESRASPQPSSGELAELCERGLGRARAHARAHRSWCFDLHTLEFVTVSAAKAHRAAGAVKRVHPTPVPSADLLRCLPLWVIVPEQHCVFTDLQAQFSSRICASSLL